MNMKHLNSTLYTDLPIDELDGRLSMEELESRLELECWLHVCGLNCPGYTAPEPPK
jgi:hypothetical protein